MESSQRDELEFASGPTSVLLPFGPRWVDARGGAKTVDVVGSTGPIHASRGSGERERKGFALLRLARVVTRRMHRGATVGKMMWSVKRIVIIIVIACVYQASWWFIARAL